MIDVRSGTRNEPGDKPGLKREKQQDTQDDRDNSHYLFPMNHRNVTSKHKESVWDYPRPPRVDSSAERIYIEFNKKRIAQTERALRVLETSHPPTYYIPKEDVDLSVLVPNARRTVCEFKGRAHYYDLVSGERREVASVWEYPNPRPGYEVLVDHLCFYPSRVDGPFKGEAGMPIENGAG